MAKRTEGKRTAYSGEDAWRHTMGDTLYEIAERGNYRLVTGSVTFLQWGKESKIKNPNYFSRLFDEFEIIEYHHNFAIPTVRFVKAYLFRKDKWEGHRVVYKELIQSFAQHEGNFPEEQLPILISKRDALEKQIERNGQRIREPLNDLLAILKVWIVEAENALLRGRKPTELSKEELGDLNELQKGAMRIWSRITGGMPRHILIENWFPKMLPRPGLPEEFVQAQASGLARHLERRDEIIEETIPLHRHWSALELVLQRALLGEPVMTEEEASAELRQEHTDVTHDRTVQIGEALHEYRKKNGIYPYSEDAMSSLTNLKEWAAQIIGFSPSTAHKALSKTGCWVNDKQGQTTGLEQTMRNAEAYYLKHSELSDGDANNSDN